MICSAGIANFVDVKVDYMCMKQAYWNLDLIHLSAENSAVHLNREFILIDNLDMAAEEASADWEFVNHPVKLSFVIVIFCVTGRMRIQLNLQSFELVANDILIVQEGAIGEYHGMDNDTRIAVIAFAPENFQTISQLEANMSLQRQLYVSPLCHLTSEAMEESLTIYRLMKAKVGETGNSFRKGALLGYVQALTYNGCHYLLSLDSDTGKAKERSSSRQQELYTRFIEEVRRSHKKERSISYYASVLCVTPKYLSQVIHKASGRFAGAWIADYVILEAKALLKSRKYTVQQIADMLNFANQSFFGKYFKDKVGYSPSDYQNS